MFLIYCYLLNIQSKFQTLVCIMTVCIMANGKKLKSPGNPDFNLIKYYVMFKFYDSTCKSNHS